MKNEILHKYVKLYIATALIIQKVVMTGCGTGQIDTDVSKVYVTILRVKP
jgi:hypothetical protein